MHMLIATDGSELAGKAVDRGLELARKTGARVTLLTATEPWQVLSMAQRAQSGVLNPVEEYETTAARVANDVLAAASAKARAADVACETHHAAGSTPAEAIVKEADRRDCDMIVMASHGRTGFDRMLLGSQTQRVLAMTERPVLVYR